MNDELQERWLLLLTMLSLLSAMHAAPSARSQCWADEQCDGESVTISCNNVTSNSPSNLSSACYCQSGNAYRCVDLCQSGDRGDGQICATVCPAYFRCTSVEAVNVIELAAVESPVIGSSLEPHTPVPTDAWWAATLVVAPIAVWLAIYFRRRKKQIVVPTSCAPTARCRLHQQRVPPSPSPTPQPSPSSGAVGSDGETGAQQRAAAAAAGDDREMAGQSPSNNGGYAESESSSTGISIDSSDGTISGYDRESAGEVRGGGDDDSASGLPGASGEDGESASGLAGASGENREPTDDNGRTTAVQPDDGVRSSRAGESDDAAMGGEDNQTVFSGVGDTGFGDNSTDAAAETGLAGDAPNDADARGRSLMRRGDKVSDSNATGGCDAGESCYVAQDTSRSDGFHGTSSEDTGASASATVTGGTGAGSPSGGEGESHNETRHAGDSEMMSRVDNGGEATGLESDRVGFTGLVGSDATGIAEGDEATGMQDGDGSDSGLATLE